LGQILSARGGRDVSYRRGAEAVAQFGDEQAGLLEGAKWPPWAGVVPVEQVAGNPFRPR